MHFWFGMPFIKKPQVSLITRNGRRWEFCVSQYGANLSSPVYSYIENTPPCMQVRFQPLIVFAPYTYRKTLRGNTRRVQKET
jgi:hypothetical protein